jgi:hypothetical protein
MWRAPMRLYAVSSKKEAHAMANNEKTSPIAKIASKGLKAPSTLTTAEIKKLAGSVLTQAADQKKTPTPKKRS